jgi:homocysteine S-methyltransferase
VTTLAEALATGPVVLDGGLATHLEAGGADLSGGLWSARMLLDPDGRRRLVQAHADFVRAGAEVLTTASYQLGARSLAHAGLDPASAGDLAARSVRVAHEAATEVGAPVWIAGSVGAHGALLADGSEYTGAYDLGDEAATVRALAASHMPRAEALLAAGADVVAVETLPRAAEVEAVAEVLVSTGAAAWVSLTVAPGGTTTRRGEPLAEAVAPLAGLPGLVAVGVNCVRPQDVAPALSVLSSLGVPLVAYPNSGEAWDAAAQRWTGSARWDDAAVPSWVAAGARLVGGCCRVGPDEVATVARTLSGEPGPERT